MQDESASKTAFARAIPSIDEILRSAAAIELESVVGREETADIIRTIVEKIRTGSEFDQDDVSREAIFERITQLIKQVLAADRLGRMQRVINATGVVIHTNLGRSKLSAETVIAACAAADYCNLEFDLESGRRGRRGSSAERALASITGAEDAIIVNNCAAAAFLVLSVYGRDGEVIVSRGELVEIGGDFRIPDILERSGARLREVGTTNRTKLADYERAICERTRLILRVHPSNYRIIGFTESPSLAELARLAHKHGLIVFEDAGSGAIVDLSRFGLDEPVIRDSIAAGADIVTFSGDKLLGASQAGLIVGRTETISKLRKDPLFRALRPDKITYAILESAFRAYAKDQAFETMPTLRYLSMSLSEIVERVNSFVERSSDKLRPGTTLTIIPGGSAVGGGAAPGVELPTALIAVEHSNIAADDIARYFRMLDTPVIGRLAEGRFLIDLRTVEPEDEDIIGDGLVGLSS